MVRHDRYTAGRAGAGHLYIGEAECDGVTRQRWFS
jgi:hypothetical protein